MASQMTKTTTSSVFLVFVLLTAAGIVAGNNILFAWSTLDTGTYLENGPYRFVMQPDCNLVLYKDLQQAIWTSGTNGKGNACRATLQSDGTLVIINGEGGGQVWNSGVAGGQDSCRLVLASDGSVVIYVGTLWSINSEY